MHENVRWTLILSAVQGRPVATVAELCALTCASESTIRRDIAALRLQGKLRRVPQGVIAFHPPCTLQHGQQLRGGVETHLAALGFEVSLAQSDSHLCCGSAGTYSVLQPELSYALRDRKLANLQPLQPEVIISANIGCIQHLQSGTATPVKHWVEVVDEALAG